jgi:hypothetical protein
LKTWFAFSPNERATSARSPPAPSSTPRCAASPPPIATCELAPLNPRPWHQGLYRIEVRDRNGNASEAVLETRYRRIRVLPPVNKSKQYPELRLTIIHAQERSTPKERDRVDWKLITDLPVTSRKEAIENLKWYSMRWKIEVFHKILKSGCKAEASKLRTANRLVSLSSVFAILSWRIFWMTMIHRAAPELEPQVAFTTLEIQLLDRLVSNKASPTPASKSLSTYLTKLARPGSYLARSSNPLPATWSYGEACPASQRSILATFSQHRIWVIERRSICARVSRRRHRVR